jgi:hypothetical protein
MTKSRKMKKGGFWESVTSGWNSVSKGASDSLNSVSQSASSLWSPKKTTTTTTTSTPTTSTTSTTSTPSPPTETVNPPTPVGGYRKKTRKMRGGCYGHSYSSSLAAHAAPVSGLRTAQASWVGGKRKTRRHKKKRSSRKH